MNLNKLESRFKAMLPDTFKHPVLRARPTELGTAVLAVVTWHGRKLRAFVIVSAGADIPAPMVADHLIWKLEGLTYARASERSQADRRTACDTLAKSIDGQPVRITFLDAAGNAVSRIVLPSDNSPARPAGD